MIDNPYIRQLLQKYIDGTYSPEELDELLRYSTELEGEQTIGDLIEAYLAETPTVEGIQNEKLDRILNRTDLKIRELVPLPQFSQRSIKTRIWRWLPYAVASIALFALCFFLYQKMDRIDNNTPVLLSDYGADVAPGINTAYLKTADGKTFNLSEQKEGIIIENAVKTADGEISFTAPIAAHEKVNEIVVPNGGQFQIKLEDGTIVKLNAGSSLKFPNKFNDQQRIVELTGEGFFMVAKNPEKPFIVKSRNQSTQVLGTQFNVRTYEDEQEVVTTLLEGAVKVKNHNAEKTLKPNEQTINSNNLLTVEKVDAANQLGWIRNEFTLDSKTIKEVLTEAGRWYNIEVVFQKEPSNELFSGAISRDSKLSSLLRLLELSDIKFRLTPNKLTVF